MLKIMSNVVDMSVWVAGFVLMQFMNVVVWAVSMALGVDILPVVVIVLLAATANFIIASWFWDLYLWIKSKLVTLVRKPDDVVPIASGKTPVKETTTNSKKPTVKWFYEGVK